MGHGERQKQRRKRKELFKRNLWGGKRNEEEKGQWEKIDELEIEEEERVQKQEKTKKLETKKKTNLFKIP